jgi:hypothetical protein
MKRGYFVHGYDETWGIAVVAPTAREAKIIVVGEFNGEEWIDICVRWIRKADVNGLDVGMLQNLREGLLRGFYRYIEGKCDECGKETKLELYSEKALCFDCMGGKHKKKENDNNKREI